MDAKPTVLKVRHRFRDYLYWNLMLAVPVITACAAILRQSIAGLFFYLILAGGAVAVVYRYFCTRCPHYIRSEGALKCMFFWGVPRLADARPGPLATADKAWTGLATAAVMLFPVPWLIEAPALLAVFVLSTVAFAVTMRRIECPRCIHFECPGNCAPKAERGPAS